MTSAYLNLNLNVDSNAIAAKGLTAFKKQAKKKTPTYRSGASGASGASGDSGAGGGGSGSIRSSVHASYWNIVWRAITPISSRRVVSSVVTCATNK
jgi:hypothetical protein